MTDRPVPRRRFVATTAGIAGLTAGLPAASATAAGAETTDESAGASAEEADGTLTAGVASRDVTPETGRSFLGYARPDIVADGVAIRVFVHALVLSDGDRKVALVSGDFGRTEIREEVLEHARPLGFDRDSVLYAATHTHAGPADVDDWVAGRIGDAIAEADANRRPARAAWAEAAVPDGNVNRSIEAHLANYGLDIPPGEGSLEDHPEDPDLARDTTLRLLRVEGTDGTPIAAWTIYANHPTTFTPANTRYSADFPGVAARWFAHRFDDGAAPVTLYSAGKLGDVITPYDDYGMYALAERTGVRVERAMWNAWEDAGANLSREFPVGGRTRLVEYAGQTVGDGERVAEQGYVGLPLLNGGENGPTPFTGLALEGRRRPEWLADSVHGRKIILAPAPWSTEVEVQAMRIGDRLLVTVPGEPTTEAGRRMERAAADAAPDDVADVSVIGVANGYNGYFTTPAEYDQQHYEGGHTVFGKYSSLLLERVHADLAAEFADGPGEPAEPSGTRPAIPDAPVDGGSADGTITDEPAETVERMETVSIGWRGGSDGEDRPVDEPFLVLERAVGRADGTAGDGRETGSDREWEPAADDLGLGFVWTESSGTYEARYDVPPDLPTGTYRLRVTAARYDLASRPFEIVPSSGLAVRGVTIDDGGDDPTLSFVAQNPAPDREENLRSREEVPRRGSIDFVVGDAEYEAGWDPDAEAWTATVPDVTEGDAVVVPEGGLVDAFGNRSGEAAELTVGEVAPLEWPENMETGGGDPPGLFGIGTIPT